MKRARVVLLASVLLTLVVACGPRYEVRNLGLAAGDEHPVGLDNGDVLISVSEADQGGTDLNGDGDSVDESVAVVSRAEGTEVVVGLAYVGAEPVPGGHAILRVPEAQQGGIDLDGDGTADDVIPHHYDAEAGTITNLGVQAGFVGPAGTGRAILSVNEPAAGLDLNGDGDQNDPVNHLWAAGSGLTNLGLAAGGFAGESVVFADESVLFPVSEVRQSADLNGDGDALDTRVFHRLQMDGTLTVAPDLPGQLQLGGDGMSLVGERHEGAAATDFNGDGDTQDTVAHHWDVGSAVTAGGFAGGPGRAIGGGSLRVLTVWEYGQGETDLNGDGDADDFVIHLWDTATGALTNLGVAGRAVPVDAAHLLVTVNECAQGEVDLNGNGVSTFDPDEPFDQCLGDDVLHTYEMATGTLVNVGVATTAGSWIIPGAGGGAVVRVSESRQGEDLDGNGVSNDEVLHHWSAAGGFRNLRKHTGGVMGTSDVGHLVGSTYEGRVGVGDLTGDGDLDDTVVLIWTDGQGFRNTRTGMAPSSPLRVLPGGAVVVLGSESWEGTDLNSDGDLGDSVWRVMRPSDS